MTKRKPSPPRRVCEACSAEFTGRKRKFCYDCLVLHAENPELYARQYRRLYKQDLSCIDCGESYRAHPSFKRCRVCYKLRGPVEKPCRSCGKLFVPRGKGVGRRTYCSDECRERPCTVCGESFLPRWEKDPCCSDDCREQRKHELRRDGHRRRRLRLKGAIKGAYHVLEIFDRDGWRCQICGGLARPWHRVPHPLAPTIDHIVPFDAGGADVASNVQCAHFKCNSMKGPRAMNDQLRLVG